MFAPTDGLSDSNFIATSQILSATAFDSNCNKNLLLETDQATQICQKEPSLRHDWLTTDFDRDERLLGSDWGPVETTHFSFADTGCGLQELSSKFLPDVRGAELTEHPSTRNSNWLESDWTEPYKSPSNTSSSLFDDCYQKSLVPTVASVIHASTDLNPTATTTNDEVRSTSHAEIQPKLAIPRLSLITSSKRQNTRSHLRIRKSIKCTFRGCEKQFVRTREHKRHLNTVHKQGPATKASCGQSMRKDNIPRHESTCELFESKKREFVL